MVSTNDNKNLGAVKGQGYSGSWELNLKKKKPRKWKYGISMLSFLPTILLAQSASVLPQIERKFITQYQEVRQLPGQLNDVLVFNNRI